MSFDGYHTWLGIAPQEQPPNHYRLLGINLFEANADVISNAADQRAVFLKTFQTGPRSAICQEILNHVSAARVCLLNASRKAAYDQELRQSIAAAMARNAITAAVPKPAPDSGEQESRGDANGSIVIARRSTKYRASRRKQSPLIFIAVGIVVLIIVGGIAIQQLAGRRGGTGNLAQGGSSTIAENDPTVSTDQTKSNGRSTNASRQPTEKAQTANQGNSNSDTKTDNAKNVSPATTQNTTANPNARNDNGRNDDSQHENVQPGRSHYLAFGPDANGELELRQLRQSSGDFAVEMFVDLHLAESGRLWSLGPWSVHLVKSDEIMLLVLYGLDSPLTHEISVSEGWHYLALSRGKNEEGQDQISLELDDTGLIALLLTPPPDGDSQNLILGGEGFQGVMQLGALRVSNIRRTWNGSPLSSSLSADESSVFVADLAQPRAAVRNLSRSPIELKLSNVRWVELELGQVVEIRAGGLDSPVTSNQGRPQSNGRPLNSSPNGSRHPIPAPDEVERGKVRVREVFGAELDRAKKGELKLEVARSMAQSLREAFSQDSVQGYALAMTALSLAEEVGDLGLALSMLQELNSRFDIDRWRMHIDSFKRCSASATTPEARRIIVERGTELAIRAAREQSFSPAITIGEETAAILSRHFKPLAKQREELVKLIKLWKELRQSDEAVSKSASDPKANLVLGRFRCFVLNAWEMGTPNLALSNEASLARAATLDQDAQSKPESVLKAADAWWDIGYLNEGKLRTVLTAEERTAIVGRARHWYFLAQSQASGLDKARVTQRIEQSDSIEKLDPRKISIPGNGGYVDVYNGFIGRVFVDGKDVGILVVSPMSFDSTRLFERLERLKLTGSSVSIAMEGRIALGAPKSVWIHTYTNENQSQSVSVNDKMILRPIDGSSTHIQLPAGEHTIAWQVNGASPATWHITLQEIGIGVTGQYVPTTIYFTQEMLDQARKPVKATKGKGPVFVWEVDLSP